MNYTPLYSPQSNGLVERQHATLKTSLKAALVDMGEKYKDRWYDFLPWILLLKRISYQKELGTSPAMLTYGTNLAIPGDLLRTPDNSLSEPDLEKLVNFMQKLDNKSAPQTTTPKQELVESPPDSITHVYTRQHNTTGLDAPYDGPFPIVSRPSRTQAKIRVGFYKNNKPRYELRHWRDLKIAEEVPVSAEAQRPKLGRIPRPAPETNKSDTSVQSEADLANEKKDEVNKLPSPPNRLIRSTRNPAPVYIDSVSVPLLSEVDFSIPPPRAGNLNAVNPPSTWSATPEELAFINRSINHPIRTTA